MARGRAAERRKNIPLVYERDGVTVRHVDMPLETLPVEVRRLEGVMKEVGGLLARVPRLKHPTVEYARYQLAHAAAVVGASTPEQMALEIGRLNFVLNDSWQVLKRLTTPVPAIREACFRLQYRQTSRKREAGWNSFKRDRDTERVGDPEEPDVDDYDGN